MRWGPVVLGTLSACSSSAPREPLAELFPLVEGSRWVFRNERGEHEIHQIEGSESVEGIPCIVYRTPESKLLYSRDVAGVLLHQADGQTVAPPILVVPEPLQAGTRWRWNGTRGPYAAEVEFVCEGEETITVPAGTFRAMRVEQKIRAAAREFSYTFWYADGVGLVQEAVEGKIARRLVSFSSVRPR